MNRIFLLFLMIGTALFIIALGQKPEQQLNYTPWGIEIQGNGYLRVFGITLEKNTLQDANQILASFPEIKLMPTPTSQFQLLAKYNEININSLLAEITLELTPETAFTKKLQKQSQKLEGKDYLSVPRELEMQVLSEKITGLIYKPSIDYSIDLILQNFGQPYTEQAISEDKRQWSYPDMGLQILIDDKGPDIFSYHPLIINRNQIEPEQ